MGEAQQTAWKLISTGNLGKIRAAFAEVNWGRIETWHPNPAPFYNVGPLWDVGIYPLTLLTAIFGPVKSVTAQTRTLLPDRKALDGKDFHVSSPDFYLILLEFINGLVVRLTADFYVERTSKFTGLEIFGDIASVYLSSWHDYNAIVEVKYYGKDYKKVSYLREPYQGERCVDWARGVADLADAIASGQPHRASAEHALHVVEIIEKISNLTQGETDTDEILSTFPAPSLMEWARLSI
jgi:predicted dehydrogenase